MVRYINIVDLNKNTKLHLEKKKHCGKKYNQYKDVDTSILINVINFNLTLKNSLLSFKVRF